jgi:hypothetical protein
MFLNRQYPRCATCHYSPSGGGLLTPYGRSLSHAELSTFHKPVASEAEETPGTGEEAFLWGALRDALGPVRLGIELRPSRLDFSVAGSESSRSLWMTADLVGAVRAGEWTAYGQIGRRPTASGGELHSYEHWVGWQREQGMGLRAGRFLPAYGIRFADHTAFNRQYLGLAQFDQVYGVEISRVRDRSLVQLSVGPGNADAIVNDDGRAAFTATGRMQYDIAPRTVIVASGLYRHESDFTPRVGTGGVAFGFSPASRATIWTQVDTEAVEGLGDLRFVVVNETSLEAFRGVWLKVSPQARLGGGPLSPDVLRFSLAAVLLPRTHWNVNLSYYRDRIRTPGLTTTVFLAQLHLYL